MSENLQGSAAVVTGASHGLGQALAERLAGLGAHVVLIARREAPLLAAAEKIRGSGGAATTYVCDVADRGQVSATAAKIQDAFGKIDILINNAGIPAPRTFEETAFDDWDAVIGVNLSGVFYVTRALWDCLKAAEAALVVNISGTAGMRGGGSPAYGGAKFGMTGLNHAIAAAGVPHRIRSTILYPGGMDTGWRGAAIGQLPRAESMDPQVVAAFIGHLASSPPEFVLNEAALNPLNHPLM